MAPPRSLSSFHMEDLSMNSHRYPPLPEAALLMRSLTADIRKMHAGPPRFRTPESPVWRYPL